MNHYKRRRGRFIITFMIGTNEEIKRDEYKSINAAKRANRGNLQPSLEKKHG